MTGCTITSIFVGLWTKFVIYAISAVISAAGVMLRNDLLQVMLPSNLRMHLILEDFYKDLEMMTMMIIASAFPSLPSVDKNALAF